MGVISRRAALAGVGMGGAALAAGVAAAPSASAAVGSHGLYYVDDQAGANDDEKFEAALAGARDPGGYTGTVVFGNRLYTLAAQHTLQSGDQIAGLAGSGDEPRSAGNKGRVRCTYPGSAFLLSGTAPHSIYIGGIQFQGTSSTVFLDGVAGQVLWTSVIEDVGFSGFKNVLGSPANKLLLTADTFKGFWNVNNNYDRAFTLGGSDCNLWTEGCLLDSPPGTVGGAGTKYHLDLDYVVKSVVGPMYITGDQNSGVLVNGSKTQGSFQGQLILTGLRSEGRNASAPTYGAVIRLEGHGTTLRDCWFAFAMSNPAATGRGDAGVIHVAGGDHLIDGCWYSRATSVAESVPYVYVAAGARARIRNIRATGSWTGKPVVTGPGVISADDSVTVV